MQQLSLIHPIYLDVPMLVSFAAAIQGGLSFTSEVTREDSNSESDADKIAAKVGTSNLLGSLFSLSAAAEHGSSSEKDSKEVWQESRRHSEASIAITLYDQLQKREGYLIRPEKSEDLQNVGAGSLVEVSGTLAKNAVDAVIDYIDAVSILAKMSPEGLKKLSQKGKGKGRQGDELTLIEHMRNILDADRKRTPISNVLVRCVQPDDLSVVVSLRTENLRDLTLSELDRNTVRVVGKVTRILSKGEVMSTFENYGLGLMKTEKLKDVFDGITKSAEMEFHFSDVEVAGPAVQILPLMVFV